MAPSGESDKAVSRSIKSYIRSVQKKSSHCSYNENGLHDIDVNQ